MRSKTLCDIHVYTYVYEAIYVVFAFHFNLFVSLSEYFMIVIGKYADDLRMRVSRITYT